MRKPSRVSTTALPAPAGMRPRRVERSTRRLATLGARRSATPATVSEYASSAAASRAAVSSTPASARSWERSLTARSCSSPAPGAGVAGGDVRDPLAHGGGREREDQPMPEAHSVQAEQPALAVEQRSPAGAARQRSGVLDQALQQAPARTAQRAGSAGDRTRGRAQ